MRGGNTLPWAGPTVWLMVAPGQLSVTVGAVQLTAAPHTPASIATGPMLAGQLAITGGCVSRLTVTPEMHVAVHPPSAEATAVIQVTPHREYPPLPAAPHSPVVAAPP